MNAPANSPIIHANKNHIRNTATTTEETNLQSPNMEDIPLTICFHNSKSGLSSPASYESAGGSKVDAVSRNYVFDFGLNTKLAGTVSFPEMVISWL
jgi:hypothetical protein